MVTRSRQVIATFAVSALLAGGGNGRERRDDPTGRQLPEHGRRFDSVDHSVDDPVHDTIDVRFGHVDVFDGHLTRALVRLTSPVPVFSSRRHVTATRRGSPPVSPPASRAALVAAVLAAIALLAAGCGGSQAHGAVLATTATAR